MLARPMRRSEFLTLELERAALLAIQRSYADLNGAHFRFQLERPSFELVDTAQRLGRWVGGQRRTIELSRALLLEHGWGVLIEVLKHEMAHQYVDEILGAPDESSHGPAFRKVCEERGFDARASGLPLGAPPTDSEGRILDRIAKLLALAESPNRHEAEAAMSAARRLMLKYNVEALKSGVRQNYTFRHLGEPTGRVSEPSRVLADLLAAHFFVQVIWVPVYRPLQQKRGTVLEVCGSLENVELAEYVHAFLSHTAERLWRDHQRARGTRKNTGRLSYLAGVMIGFRDKLAREKQATEEPALVYRGDGELGRFFKRRHPYVRHTRHLSRAGSDAYSHGRRAGQNIVLHRGVRSGYAEGLPRLLPSGR
jgi:hypothetical protein